MASLSSMSKKQLKEIREELIAVLEMSNGSIEMGKVLGTHNKMFKKTLKIKKYGLSLRRLALINADVMEVIPMGKKGNYNLQFKSSSQAFAEPQAQLPPYYKGTAPTVTPARPIKKKTIPEVKQSPTDMLKECLESELRQLLKKKKKGLKMGQLAKSYKAHFFNSLRAMLGQCKITYTVEAIARAFNSVFALEKEKKTKQSRGRNKLQLKRRLKTLDTTVIELQEPSSPGLYPCQTATSEEFNQQEVNSQKPEGSRKRALPLADERRKGKKKLKKSLSENAASKIGDKGNENLESTSEHPTNDIGSNILATSEGHLQQQQHQCMTRRQQGYQFHSKEDVLAQCFISNLAKANELVTVHRVMELLLLHYHVSNVQELGLHHETVLPAVNRLVKLQSKVNAFIQAFVKVRAVCTLYELREYLAKVDMHRVGRLTRRDFADLGLGPLSKQPLVWEYFRFPASKNDADIPRITTMDVMKEVSDYLTERNLWSKRLELEDFMAYLIIKYDVDEPLELGLRITSIAIVIDAIRRANRESQSTWLEVCEKLKPFVVKRVKQSVAKINKAVMSPAKLKDHCFTTGPQLEVRNRYVNMKASHAVRAVFDNACQIGHFSSRLRGLCLSLERVMADPMSCSLFQLAICCGDLSRPDDLPKGIAVKTEETKEEMRETRSNPAEETHEKSHPTLDQVKRELMCHFDGLQHGLLNLKDLACIETKLCQHFGFQNFQSLSQTKVTFLEFLSIDHPEVLDGVCDGLMGLRTDNPNQGSLYRPSRLDLVEFIKQCDPHNESQDTVDGCLCAHYQVNTVEELGHGPVSRLSQPIIKMAATLGQYQQDSNAVIYETALCAANRRNESKRKEVGLFGSQRVEDALLCLQSAPLLEDLAEWSHWTMVFEPEHGDLKAFLERNLGQTLSPPIKINALEVRPGVLLRLAMETSNYLFADAAKSGDSVNTVGHLVSLVVEDGPNNELLALLSNHMETALNMMDVASDHRAAVAFILECLVAVPLQIGQAVVRQVFLNPLVNVLGSEVKSRQLILASCKSTRQKSRIQSLGLLLGISQWKDSFLEERMPRNMDNQQDLSGYEEEVDVNNFLSLKKTHQAEEVQAEDVQAEDVQAEEVQAEDVQAEEVQAEEVQAEEVQAEEVQAEEVQAEEVQAEEVQAEEVQAEEVPPKVEENHPVTNACDETVSINPEKLGEGEDSSCLQILSKQEMKESIQKDAGVETVKEMDENVETETINQEQEVKKEVKEKKCKDILDVEEEEVKENVLKVVDPVQPNPVQAKPESDVATTSQEGFEDVAAISSCPTQSGSKHPTFKLNKDDFLSRSEFCSLKEWPPPKWLLKLFSAETSPNHPPQPKEPLSGDGIGQEEAQSTVIHSQGGQDNTAEQSSPREQGKDHTEEGFGQDAPGAAEHHFMTGEPQPSETHQAAETSCKPAVESLTPSNDNEDAMRASASGDEQHHSMTVKNQRCGACQALGSLAPSNENTGEELSLSQESSQSAEGALGLSGE